MKLKCPECRKAFKWDTDNPWPRFCPLCRADINNDRDADDIVMPFIQCKGLVKSSDALYRKIETGSETRQEMAASHLGVSRQDVAELKITDLKDARQPGQIAAVEASAAEARLKAANPHAVPAFQGANGSEFKAGISTGTVTLNDKVVGQNIYPRAGATAVGRVQKIMGLG